jgi:hypothetical protein
MGAFFCRILCGKKTGLSAPIFASQKFRFYPLRWQIAARFALGVSLRETPAWVCAARVKP